MFFQLIVLYILTFGYSQSPALARPDLENFDLNGRIIGGSKATWGQFPWQAAITVLHGDRTYVCGGALIGLEWILTAAHCVDRASAFSVRLGSLTSSGPGESPTQVIPGERGIYHPQYNPTTLNNDIALIKLAHRASSNQYVRPIQLANPIDLFPPGTEVLVSGWGRTRDGGSLNMDLMFAKLRTITNDECKNYYNSEIIKHSNVCCRGNKIESTCHGDDGGALVRWDLYNSTHVGVVSLISSVGCEHGMPSVYERTASFRDWIRENTGI